MANVDVTFRDESLKGFSSGNYRKSMIRMTFEGYGTAHVEGSLLGTNYIVSCGAPVPVTTSGDESSLPTVTYNSPADGDIEISGEVYDGDVYDMAVIHH